MSDNYTVLNKGCGGDAIDEEGVSFPTAPTTRKRSRVVIGGSDKDELARVTNAELDGSEYGLVTRSITQRYPGTSVISYNEVTLVTSNSETTVVSYTVPVSNEFNFLGVSVTGDIPARYRIFVAAAPMFAGRTTVATPNYMIEYSQAPFVVAAGTTIYLKATHYFSGLNGNFEGTIIGYNLTV